MTTTQAALASGRANLTRARRAEEQSLACADTLQRRCEATSLISGLDRQCRARKSVCSLSGPA